MQQSHGGRSASVSWCRGEDDVNGYVPRRCCRGRHSVSISHLVAQHQGSCAHGFVQGKNKISVGLPADPLPCLSFEACCCRPLPFLSLALQVSGASASQCCSRAGPQGWLSRVNGNRAASEIGHRSASRFQMSFAVGQTPCLCEASEPSHRAPGVF